MAKSSIVVNERALARAVSQDVQSELRRRAERIADQARSIAPVITGTYRDSIHVVEETADGLPVFRVVAGVKYAVYVEAEDGPLTRSIDAGRSA